MCPTFPGTKDVTMSVRAGDRVLLPEWGGSRVKVDKEEFFLYLKLVLLGLGVVGIIGFMLKLIQTGLPSVFG